MPRSFTRLSPAPQGPGAGSAAARLELESAGERSFLSEAPDAYGALDDRLVRGPAGPLPRMLESGQS
jgi:hypothetical protein